MSGVTVPLTMLSPSPQLALTTSSSRLPVIGLALKTTADASAGTICCTSTAILVSSIDNPCLRRYSIARSDDADAQHLTTASTTFVVR